MRDVTGEESSVTKPHIPNSDRAVLAGKTNAFLTEVFSLGFRNWPATSMPTSAPAGGQHGPVTVGVSNAAPMLRLPRSLSRNGLHILPRMATRMNGRRMTVWRTVTAMAAAGVLGMVTRLVEDWMGSFS